MAIKRIADYKENRYRSFPSESIPKYEKKESNYYLDMCKAFLHSYTNESANSLVKYKSHHLAKLEAYANGTQGNKLVKDKLLRMDKQTGKHYGKMGKVFQTYDLLPEMLDVIYSINAKQKYAISTIAIDEISTAARKLEAGMVKFLMDRNTQAILDKLGHKMVPDIDENEMALYTDADIDALFESGGIQLDWEMAAKAACNSVALNSQVKEVENRNTEELIKWGFTAVRPYIDKSTNRPKIRNVDMKNLIVRDSKYNDFRDITRFAEIRWISLIELKELCPSLNYDQYVDIIEGAVGYQGNEIYASYLQENNFRDFYHGESSLMDEIQIPILEAQWLANDVEHRLYFEKYGQERSKVVSSNTELSKKEKKNNNSISKKKFVKRYDAVWLIGSDILLEYGPAKSNSYYGPKGNRVPRLDISIVKTGKKSIVERCVNFVEDINLAVTKLRSAIATLPPAPMLIVYQHALRNVKINKKEQTAADLIRGLIEEGVMVVNGQDEKGNFNTANGGKAVENLNINVAEQVVTFTNEIQAKIAMIRQVIGLPEGLDGTSGNPYQALGQTQMAAAASSNATFPVLSPISPLYERAYSISIGQYQALATDEDIEIQDLSLSERAANVFKLSKEFTQADFNIKLVYAPNDQEKEFMITKIVELEAAYTASGGAAGLRTSEYLILYRLIQADRIEEAIRTIAKFERLRQIEADKRSQALQQQNGQIQQDSARVSEEEKRSTLLAKGEEDRKNILLEKGLDSLNKTRDAEVSSHDREGSGIPTAIADRVKQEVAAQISPMVEDIFMKLEEERMAREAQQQQAIEEQQ